jgi:hypothetical protein
LQDKPLRIGLAKIPGLSGLKAPDDQESFTVADVLEATNPQEHRKLADQWAQTV